MTFTQQRHSHLPFWEANTVTEVRILFLIISVLLPQPPKHLGSSWLITNLSCYQEMQTIAESIPTSRHIIQNRIGKNGTVSDMDPFLFIMHHECCRDPRHFNFSYIFLGCRHRSENQMDLSQAYWRLIQLLTALRVWYGCWGMCSRARHYARYCEMNGAHIYIYMQHSPWTHEQRELHEKLKILKHRRGARTRGK